MTAKHLATLTLSLLAAAPARADTWETPRPRDYRSANGTYVFRVVPTDANWFKPAEGTLLSRDKDGRETVVWRKQLVNLPHQAFVADDGRHVVTVDTYARCGYQHALVLYGKEGKLLADYDLDDLLRPEEVGKHTMQTVSSRFWAQQAKLAFAGDGKRLTVEFKWDRTITLDLTSGAIDPKVHDVPPVKAKRPDVAGRNDPPPGSAESLNRLLDDLRKRPAKGAGDPPIPLGPELLARVAVLPRKGGPDVAVLRAWPRLNWPDALRTPAWQAEARRFGTLLEGALEQARRKPLSEEQTRDLKASHQVLGAELVRGINDLAPAQFIASRRLLNRLGEALESLRKPGVGDVLAANAALAGRCKNAADLVEFMADRDLGFAPPAPGDEDAYLAVQRALAALQKAEKTGAGSP